MVSRPTTSLRYGFTLIEIIMVIVVVGIVAGIMAPVLRYGADSYRQQVARREIVSRARMSLERMAREIRQAVPNTIRLHNTVTTNDVLEFGSATHFSRHTAISGSGPYTLHDNTGMTIPASPYLVIYNTDPASFYGFPASFTTFAVTGTGANTVSFNAALKPDSPTRRHQLSDGPVAFGLTGAGDVFRYSGYAPGQNFATATADLLIDQVNLLQFRYSPGTLTNTGLVTIHMGIAIGDQVLEFHQEVHVRNVP